MKERIVRWADKNRNKLFVASYIFAGAVAAVSYLHAKEAMIVQDAWIWIIKSNVTFNFILFLFLWGLVADKYTKHMPKKKGWLIWGVGFIIIILIFRFIGGMETIFG